MKFNIHNHENTATISVEHMQHVEPVDSNGLVMVTGSSVGFSFKHMMTTQQAQFMASALLMAAENAAETILVKPADVQHVPSDDTEGGAE